MVLTKLRAPPGLKIHNAKTALSLLKASQKEIGLTDDEVLILLYTSVDQTILPHLIVQQTELGKWFFTNFADESRAELDFLESK
jgi:hypothetical protein